MRRLLFTVLALVLFALAPRAALAKETKAAKPAAKTAKKAPPRAPARKNAKKTPPWLDDPLRIQVKNAPDAYYYAPRERGQKPVIMYLHGRGGNPAADCRKWAEVGTRFGWVVCPQGSGVTDSGGRTWSNGPGDAQRVLDATIQALRAKYRGKVQLRNNILVGFSEGAWVAMNVGLKDQRTWSRWLILGASDAYWGDVSEALAKKNRKVQRVYLLTGERDGVAQKTVRVGETLKKVKVPVRVDLVPGLGHEVPKDRMTSTYRRPLAWLLAAK